MALRRFSEDFCGFYSIGKREVGLRRAARIGQRQEKVMELSAFFPTRHIGHDPAKIRDWSQAAEDLGYAHIEVPDHVFGATARGDWKPVYSEKDAFHETFTTMAYLAAVTKKVRLASGVLILPQRQTGLVAKQAAEIDLLSGGRLRLGVGVGWNHVEYESLGMT
jgi:alkanesulfonate monooxygenase SsuD/methylene tetrahydromethanopterin reductase-like flavin-dependent oxidoreductase (luciferase family)